ncbi:unnamed protein product [Bursaphelenchus okinawaensis]|uniref:Uncharacterized protein n=1 Tax=Bursaphelenchus okinawaensis TaxID=465554 RepID=A0A811LFR2_9BILA|nr:unnamed protein product [Bursaphelenchus okinawaensis]CAG9121608.1 unnamed protein product [Bursaphelenchus okinawaensis]
MNQNLMNNHNIPQEGYSPGQNHGYNYRANQLHIDVGNNGQGNFISPDPSAQPSYYPTNSGPRSDSYAHINDELCVPQQKKSCSVSPSNYFNHQYPSYHNMDSNRQDTMGRQDSMGRQDTMSNIRSEGLRQDTIRYDTFNEQPWRKSSLAPNMRLNSSHSPSSGGYMNYGQVKKSTNFNYNQYDQPVVRKTSFALFDDKKENRKDSLFPAKSYTNLTKPDKTRSQSLSAAEFLKREGNAKPLVKQNQSLWQHASKLRSAKNSIVGAAPTKHQLGLTYTPPPMLMPKRSGTGLYWSIRKNCEFYFLKGVFLWILRIF